MRRLRFVLGVLMGIGVLAGCRSSLLPSVDLNVDFSKLSYTATVDAETGGVGFTTEALTLTVNAKAGSLGGHIESYTIEYLFADGSQVIPGDNVSRGAVGLNFPAGIVCPASDSTIDCTINTTGAVFAPGASISKSDIPGVPGQISVVYWCDTRTDIGPRQKLP
ncbi:MAG: hypothetical protein R2880_05325 [Deinococcales bacterium]